MYDYSVYHNGGLSSYLLIKLLWCSLNILFCVLCYLIDVMGYILRMLCKFSVLDRKKRLVYYSHSTPYTINLRRLPRHFLYLFQTSVTFPNLRYSMVYNVSLQLPIERLVLLLQTTFLCPSKTKCDELPLFA